MGRLIIAAVVLLAAIAGTVWFLDAPIAQNARLLPPYMRRFFGWVTLIGSSGYIFALSALFATAAAVAASPARDATTALALRLLAGRAAVVFTVTATSGIASQVLKHLIGRSRPRLLDSAGAWNFDPLSFASVQASFPSGHTITAFAMAWTLGLFLPAWRIPLFGMAILIAISRVVVGAHYPGDVLAGAVVGMAAAWLTCRAFGARHLVLRYWRGSIVPRGEGLISPALRSLAGGGKASAP